MTGLFTHAGHVCVYVFAFWKWEHLIEASTYLCGLSLTGARGWDGWQVHADATKGSSSEAGFWLWRLLWKRTCASGKVRG